MDVLKPTDGRMSLLHLPHYDGRHILGLVLLGALVALGPGCRKEPSPPTGGPSSGVEAKPHVEEPPAESGQPTRPQGEADGSTPVRVAKPLEPFVPPGPELDRTEPAIELVRSLLKLSERTVPYELAKAHASLAAARIRKGKTASAVAILRLTINAAESGHTKTTLIDGVLEPLVKADTDVLATLVGEAVVIWSARESTRDKVRDGMRYARLLQQAGFVDQSAQLVRIVASVAREVPEQYNQSISAATEIIEVLAEMGAYEQARSLARTLPDTELAGTRMRNRGNALAQVAAMAAQRDDLAEASQAIKESGGGLYYELAQMEMAVAFARTGNAEAALVQLENIPGATGARAAGLLRVAALLGATHSDVLRSWLDSHAVKTVQAAPASMRGEAAARLWGAATFLAHHQLATRILACPEVGAEHREAARVAMAEALPRKAADVSLRAAVGVGGSKLTASWVHGQALRLAIERALISSGLELIERVRDRNECVSTLAALIDAAVAANVAVTEAEFEHIRSICAGDCRPSAPLL